MFEILHPSPINSCKRPTHEDLNFRRKRTDIFSVDSLNYCKQVKASSTQTTNRMNPATCSNKVKKKDVAAGTLVNVNVKLTRELCDCRKKKEVKDKRDDDCTRVTGEESANAIDREMAADEDMIMKKELGELQAAAPGSKSDKTKAKSDSEKLLMSLASQKLASAEGFDWRRTYWFGEKGSGFKTKAGGPQDFYKIRAELLKSGSLFEDPEFPATNYSLFASDRADRHFQWKRPGNICNNPQLFVEGFSRFDVQQGELGDCWLLAATANLTMYKRLFFQIVPDDQGFGEDYAGIFHFRFWQYGRWVDIVIDDRLPTDGGKLVYLHSTEENEFWSALLEKAYAKLHGSYEALKGGSTCEAMEDFTGGVTEMYELDNPPPNLFKILDKAFQRASLMGCSLEPDPNVLEAETPEGLIRGHAYSITKVVYLDIATPNVTGKIPLLRLRNPWGNEAEWNGPWSDGAPEWKYISEDDKKRLGLIFDNDGEFFMSYKDWEKHFDRLEICNLNPDSLSENETKNKKKWEMSIFEGAWVRGITAGGCRNFLETFWNNPQYRITLTDVDDDDEDNKCTCIVALMQKNRRQIKTSSGEELLTIGFAIYYLPNPDHVPKPLDMNFFKYNASVARSPSFINLREVSCRFKLPPGTYCIVPSTYDANDQGEFLLRVFSEHQNNMQEHDDTIGYKSVDERIGTAKKATAVHAATPTKKSQKISAEKASDFEMKRKEKSIIDFNHLAGEDGEVDYLELRELLNKNFQSELRGTQFSKEVCRCMVAMLDTDYSGKLGDDEFKELWDLIMLWEKAFFLYDVDNSGALSGFELRNALGAAGYRLTNHVLNILMHRYGNEEREITFDEFILCAVRLKTMIDKFQQRERQNVIILSREEWMEATLYC